MNDNNAKPLVTDDVGAKLLMLVGEMGAQVGALREDIGEVKAAMEGDRHAAQESRRRIYEKLEDGDRRITKLESTVRAVGLLVDRQGKDVEALKPTVEATAAKVRSWTLRGGLIGTALVAVLGFVWWLVQSNWIIIWRFFDQFVPKG